MSRFFPLTIADIRQETRDAVVLTLKPRNEDRDRFNFIQGQYLTFRHDFEGEELRRSYSICAGIDDGILRVGIKRVDGGYFSNWANESLKTGDTIEAMPPMGTFHAPLEPEKAKHYLGFAGGSGITPVIGIIKTVLAREPKSQFTLVYGNRSVNAIMFREELEDLKNRYLGRFSVLHVLEGESRDIDLFSGRLDEEKCNLLFDNWIDAGDADMAFICGPEPMMLAVAASLRKHGMPDERIKLELFSSPARRIPPKQAAQAETAKPSVCHASVTLDGTARKVDIARPGQTVLEAAIAAGMDAPYACRAGVCASCRAMVLEGEVEMQANHALEDYEVRRGYVLTCQSLPLTDTLVVDYDR